VIYVFRAQRANRIKLVVGGAGLCPITKKLEQGDFRWPGIKDGVIAYHRPG
jgi:transposase